MSNDNGNGQLHKQRTRVASFASYFNIFRDPHDPATGEVTLEEMIKSIGRHLRWHERQVVVARTALQELEAKVKARDEAATLPPAA